MAYWARNKLGHVYVYSRASGELKKLPRKETKHLDAEIDSNIDAWVSQWTAQYEGKRSKDSIQWSDSRLTILLNQYISFMANRGKSPTTYKQHKSLLYRYGIPYFLNQTPPLADPNQWPGASIRLIEALENKGLSYHQIFRTNVALRGFYDFLRDEGVVQNHLQLRLRNPVKPDTAKETPLDKIITPEVVLAKLKAVRDVRIRLLGLIGFFFSLRPQEVFALKPSDFKAGSEVKFLECSQAMSQSNLYERFVVHISRQRTNKGDITPPKAGSKGWVSCFNKDAAMEIVKILNQLNSPDDEIFTLNNRELYKKWNKVGIRGITLKDLRRSSLYWLGHHASLEPLLLKQHARHNLIETTMLYMRRPDEELRKSSDSFVLDLEA